MKRWLIAGVVISMILFLGYSMFGHHPFFYWGEAIHGRVVDAESGEPIEGAVVLVDWKLYSGGMGHGGHRDPLFVQETVTDARGEFAFDKWGPIRRPLTGALDTAPWFVVFKSGYEHRFLLNEHHTNDSVRRSDWNEKTITLKRFKGDATKRVDVLSLVLSISELQPRLLKEILTEKALYYRADPRLFDHIENLLLKPPRELQ
jgi:hypothetical protein